MIIRAIAIASLLIPLVAEGALVRLVHPYGELIDEGGATAYLEAPYPDRIDCTIPPGVVLTDRNVTITARRVTSGASEPQCLAPVTVELPPLAAGWWTVTLRILDATGTGTIAVDTSAAGWIDEGVVMCVKAPAPK